MRQALLTGLYVFVIIIVASYGGQAVMNAFGISIPGLRIGGGLIARARPGAIVGSHARNATAADAGHAGRQH